MWTLDSEQLPELLAAFVDAEERLQAALSRAVQPFGYFPSPPEIDRFRPDQAEWRVTCSQPTYDRPGPTWRPTPDRPGPSEMFRCLLDLKADRDGHEVSGWLETHRYVGHGLTGFFDVWRSADYPVESPREAAAAIRRVAEELAAQLGSLDLSPYLDRNTAEPGGTPDTAG